MARMMESERFVNRAGQGSIVKIHNYIIRRTISSSSRQELLTDESATDIHIFINQIRIFQ